MGLRNPKGPFGGLRVFKGIKGSADGPMRVEEGSNGASESLRGIIGIQSRGLRGPTDGLRELKEVQETLRVSRQNNGILGNIKQLSKGLKVLTWIQGG